jgi:hypothetical protein
VNSSLKWALALALFLGRVSSWAEETKSDAMTAPLYRQVALIDDISENVERAGLARLMDFRSAIEAVISNTQENVASGRQEATFETFRLIQNLVFQYHYSQTYFGWTSPPSITSIYTNDKTLQLAELKKLADQLAHDYGLDGTPYTQITARLAKWNACLSNSKNYRSMTSSGASCRNCPLPSAIASPSPPTAIDQMPLQRPFRLSRRFGVTRRFLTRTHPRRRHFRSSRSCKISPSSMQILRR